MKTVVFDRHAKRRMKEREVSADEAMEAMEHLDSMKQSLKGRMNSFKCISGRYLRVTHKAEPDRILVITVTIRKKPFKEQKDEN